MRAFDCYINHRPWMTLSCQNAAWCRKDACFGAYCKNLNKGQDRAILSATKI